jgi:hypothetical protein
MNPLVTRDVSQHLQPAVTVFLKPLKPGQSQIAYVFVEIPYHKVSSCLLADLIYDPSPSSQEYLFCQVSYRIP